jgi:hypothetical protein
MLEAFMLQMNSVHSYYAPMEFDECVLLCESRDRLGNRREI